MCIDPLLILSLLLVLGGGRNGEKTNKCSACYSSVLSHRSVAVLMTLILKGVSGSLHAKCKSGSCEPVVVGLSVCGSTPEVCG